MPPIRSMSNIKPVKTERTHEENQERAYIAASRRSDRSLEARVESARRASEIHKRRTGRSLRVTEQDVVNEEMYEEEDDDLPMQYRRLTAHLQTSNADFTRRLQAYVAQHVEMRTALGQAIAGGWQGNQSQQNSTQFMNPSFMQMQSSGLPNPMLPPQMLNRSPSAYRQTPYPMPNVQQSMAPNQRGRSMSNASPHDFASFNQQHSQSAQTTPVDTMKMDERRVSLPPHNVMPQIPQSQHGAQQSVSPDHQSPVASRTGSSTNLAAVHGVFKHPPRQSPQLGPTPSQQHQQSFSSPSNTNPNYMQDISPLTTMMPLNDQQLLATSPDMNDPFFAGPMLGLSGMKSQQPFYSYNPNGKPKNGSGSNVSQTTFDGLNQTLMPSQLETKASSADMFASPNSSVTDSVITPYSGDGFGFSYDGAFNGFEPLRAVSSNNTSGQITPAENESQDISGWLDHGVYEDNFTTNATV